VTTMCSPLSCACAIAPETRTKLVKNVKRIRDMGMVLTRVLKSFQCFGSPPFSPHVRFNPNPETKAFSQSFFSRGVGRDALPSDPRQDVRWLTLGAAPPIVCTFRRVRRSTSTDAFQTCDAGRAGVPLPSEAVQRTRPIGRADADQAGARPYHLQWRITFLIACEPGSGGSNFSNNP
jgi:hypothetical protein